MPAHSVSSDEKELGEVMIDVADGELEKHERQGGE